MKILQLPRRFVTSHWGGTETVILETCKRLVMMGYETSIVCPNALAIADNEVIEGVAVKRVPYFYPYLGLRSGAKALLDRKGGNLFSFALMKALRSEPHVDLIHLHTAKRAGGIGRHVARKRKIPYVLSLHGGAFDVPTEEAATWTEPTSGSLEWGKILGWWVGSRKVFDDAAAILCVGEQERVQTQRNYPEKKVVHLPNGVDPDRFSSGDGKTFRDVHGIPQKAFVILTMGRIDPQKNQLSALKLLPKFSEIHRQAHLLIIGHVTNEEYCDQLLHYMLQHSLESRCTIIPGLEANSHDLTDAYHCADLFLLPSIHEPFGIVILEAWAAGLPVLASRIGGIPSFVIPYENGLLFEPNNNDAIIDAFRFVVENPELSKRLAENGQRKARDQYSWDVITRRLVDIYEEAILENPLRK